MRYLPEWQGHFANQNPDQWFDMHWQIAVMLDWKVTVPAAIPLQMTYDFETFRAALDEMESVVACVLRLHEASETRVSFCG